MPDIQRMYASLSHAAETVPLDPPETLRRKGDRRIRVTVVAAAVAVAAIAGALTIGGQRMFTTNGPPVEPGTTTTQPAPTSVVSPPTPTPVVSPPAPTEVSASAFLHAADTNGGAEPVDVGSDYMLPQLCGATFASDTLIQARKTMYLMYWVDPAHEVGILPDGTFYQTITTYNQGGAEQFMQQLRDAVGGCPTEQRSGTTYRNSILTGTSRGDDSILIEQRYPTRDAEGSPIGGDDVRLVSVVRTGEVVMVLYEQGWEAGWSADPQVVDTFTGKAFARLQDWLQR